MSRRISISCLLALAALAALVGAPSAGAKKASPTPAITKVSPMRVKVGGTLTITGRHFRSRAKRNTVIFRASNGRSAFVKPRRASRRKLVLTVTAPVARLLTIKNSSQRPTRLKLRVLAGKFSKFTTRRLSPLVVGVGSDEGGGGGGGGSAVCDSDSDHDNDLLSNSLEKSIGTDPCLEDTDSDAMIDGWEYYSAKDLNIKAVPYPGKRPFPNALDPSDGKSGSTGYSAWDFDGDGLKTYEEYRAWRITGRSFDASRVGGLDLASPLGYSDGTQASRASEVPSVPSWKSGSFGLTPPSESYPAIYDRDISGTYEDDERDADRDGLGNFIESIRGPGQVTWWPAYWASVFVDPWPDTYYGAFDERPFQDLDLADSDVDGDTLLDGEDDQDFDDWKNVTELYNAGGQIDVGGGVMRFVNNFNPCAPTDSRTCDTYTPIG